MNPRNSPRNNARSTPRNSPRNTDVLALQARGLVKRYGHVTALGGADVELRAGEVLAVIGDNGAGKSTLIKCLSGAEVPDAGEIRLFGEPVRFRNPLDARDHGLETVYQNLAVAPSRDIPANLFLGRERRRSGPLGRVFRLLDKKGMREETRELLTSLGLLTIQNFSQPVETLSGGQRQGVAVARAACFGSRVIIMDEPTAALGVRESQRVLDLIREIRDRGVPVVLISHDMPHVFDVADRIHVQRLGRRVALVNTSDISMPDAVALMTGALDPAELDGRSPAGTP
jgi:fructose transport system ATP-binding protein